MKFFRKFSTIPTPAIAFSCLLKSRGLLCISGKDVYNVLQGISTNNLKIFSQDSKRTALHTCFLNSSGRVLADALLIRPSIVEKNGRKIKEDEVWVDVERSQLDQLKKHLKTYSIRKKILINDLSDEMKIFAINSPYMFPGQDQEGVSLNEMKKDEENEKRDLNDEYDNYDDLMFVDPRCARLGMRIIIHKDDEFDFQSDEKLTEIDELAYKKFRIIYGICQGEEVKDIVPFQANFDLMKSISFDKGCYLGQELMARAYYTGIIRKRMIPFIVSNNPLSEDLEITKDMRMIKNSFKEDLKDKYIVNENNQKIGKVLFNVNNVGIGLFNYLDFEKIKFENKPLHFKLEDLNCGIIWNDWLFNKIDKYIEFLKEKKMI